MTEFDFIKNWPKLDRFVEFDNISIFKFSGSKLNHILDEVYLKLTFILMILSHFESSILL